MPDIASLPSSPPVAASTGVATRKAATAPGAPAPAPRTAMHPAALRRQLAELAPPAQTHLRFHVEEGLGCVAVSVIDERTGEVLMQVPSETALRIARRLRAGGGLLDEQA